MDSLSHLLVGHLAGLAAAGLGGPHAQAAYWGLLVGNSLPDLDVPASLLIRGDTKLHRTATHTLTGAVVLSLAAALVIARFQPAGALLPAFGWTLAGALVHIGLDALNLFGVKLLRLNRGPVAAGVLHIVDPALLTLWSVATLGELARSVAPLVSAAALALSVIYIGWRFLRARQLRRTLRQAGALRADIIPWYCGWRYVDELPDRIEFGRWDGGRPTPLRVYPKPDASLINRLRGDSEVQQFLATARYPYAVIQADEIVWGCALRQVRADYRPLHVKMAR